MKPLKLLFLCAVVSASPISMADTCPPPPSSIDPSIISSVSYDKKSKLYKYRYEVQNGRGAQIPIESFILQMDHAPTEITSPTHWSFDFVDLSHMPLHVLWDSIPSSKYKSVDIAPGERLSGFAFQSAQSPGLIQYWAQGRTGVPAASPPSLNSPDDEPEPNCPDWDFNSPRFRTLVTGITTGPLPPGTVPVSMRLREETGSRSAAPINPANPTGKVSVLILATKKFDPSQIVISSIQFGPDNATPISSKLTPARDDDDRNSEREQWEGLSLDLGDGHDRDKDPKKQNLLLIFDQAALGVRCVLDKAVILTGKTQAGINIVGGASTRLIGCDIRHPGKRHRKPDPNELESALKKQRRLERAKGNQ